MRNSKYFKGANKTRFSQIKKEKKSKVLDINQ